MGNIVACTNLTLDGVMQAPGRPDEDTRGGFTHGGWAAPYGAMAHVGQVFANAGALLFGRRTYADFYDVWPTRTESPFTPWLNNIPKYVASASLKQPLPWSNSTLLAGDLMTAVAQLKQLMEKDVLILGSGALIRSLMRSKSIDHYVLLIHPLVLGAGHRLFADDGTRVSLTLVSSSTTPSGVVVATYGRVEAASAQT